MEKKYARLAALLAAAVLCGNGAPSMAAGWWVGDGTKTITITAASKITDDVYGNQDHPDANGIVGHVEMTGGTVTGDVHGGYSSSKSKVSGSTVAISGGKVTGSVLGGYSSSYSGEVSGNTVTITGGTVTRDVYGGRSNGGVATGNTVTITDGTVNSIYGGGCSNGGAATCNTVAISGGEVTRAVYGGDGGEASDNTVAISGGSVDGVVYGGCGWSKSGKVSGNTVTISGGIVGTVDSSRSVYGGYSYGGGEVSGNTVALSGSADVKAASLYGRNDGASTSSSGNTLLIDGWSGSAKSVKNFDEVTFRNIRWKTGGTVLDITDNKQENLLENTKVKVEQLSMAGGTVLHAEDTMTLIQSNKDTGIDLDKVDVTEASEFTAGVTAVGTGSAEMDGEKKLVYKISNVERNTQTDLIAENRAVAAAFVNQGADIAADSLRLLDDGYHYGMQTFGAVYGNRSQYDVNSDIKINGWSEIAGFGNIHEVKDGRLAWGVFYENGTGNYRTWNTFNNEMFRGDGSLLYNGGGAAIRLTKDSGMYYEASLRAGTLSSSMSNAVKDGNGNSYGFDSDSTYWGAHVGAGKLIQRGSGQWDIYGKYFHTDIDGDSFEMGGDRFSFDSVTSDRLRLGARYTADTDKAWSLYCGAAYEYEFSGDSHMKAGQFEAPGQSLQGSTVFGEIGTVWGRKDSPWSMDINLRGYAGEREGFSGMVQLAYAF